jgi:hypothetical protein
MENLRTLISLRHSSAQLARLFPIYLSIYLSIYLPNLLLFLLVLIDIRYTLRLDQKPFYAGSQNLNPDPDPQKIERQFYCFLLLRSSNTCFIFFCVYQLAHTQPFIHSHPFVLAAPSTQRCQPT